MEGWEFSFWEIFEIPKMDKAMLILSLTLEEDGGGK